jgi:hypothetical protein
MASYEAAAVKAFDLDVPTVGSIASGLPAYGLPDIRLADLGELAAGGIGVMLVAFAGGARSGEGLCGPRDGRQLQPLQDGGQCDRRRSHAGLGDGRTSTT